MLWCDPLKIIETHFSGLSDRSRSVHLSSKVSKRDWRCDIEEENTERSSANAFAECRDE